MKRFTATTFAGTALAAIGFSGLTLAHHDTGSGEVKVTPLSQREIVEKLEGQEASATVLEVTFGPGQKDTPHRLMP